MEYSAEAGAAAHAIGRVTCAPDGVDERARTVNYSVGFFHAARSDAARRSGRAFYNEAISKMRDTQCDAVDGEDRPTADGRRRATAAWPRVAATETDMNPEGGFCGMPTQFLGTVRVGGQHRTPRWVSSTQDSASRRPDHSPHQSACRAPMRMYLPLELLNLSAVDAPSSPSLARFEGIAWDGANSTSSAWDSCEVGCAIPVLENRLCGGAAARGLDDFDWTEPYCARGVAEYANYAAGGSGG